MRAFRLARHTDVSGVSGVGYVAEGIEFSDGTVVLRWMTDWPTSVVFHDRGIESVEAIHGHNGATQIEWLDAPTLCRDCNHPLIALDEQLSGAHIDCPS